MTSDQRPPQDTDFPQGGPDHTQGKRALTPQLAQALGELDEPTQQILADLLAQDRAAGPRPPARLALSVVQTLLNRVAGPTDEAPVRVPLPFKNYPEGESISLDDRAPALPMALGTALRRRRSRYHFSSDDLDLTALGGILNASYGINRSTRAYGWGRYPLNVAPSAGGLQPVNIYVLATRVQGLHPGLYYFHPYQHALQAIRQADLREAAERSLLQPEFLAAPALLVLTCSLDRALWKYPLRHYRTVHIDTGIVTQNLYLTATALGLGVCAIAGFQDDEVHALVGVDGHREFATVVVAVGLPGQPTRGG